MNDNSPKTLMEAVAYFADAAVTFKAMLAAKWPDGKIACPKCNGEAIDVERHPGDRVHPAHRRQRGL